MTDSTDTSVLHGGGGGWSVWAILHELKIVGVVPH